MVKKNNLVTYYLLSLVRMIRVDKHIQLDRFTKEDKSNLVKYINHPIIYRNTLTIPYPYTDNDAEWWLLFIGMKEKQEKMLTNWVIRLNGRLIGGVGLLLKYPREERRDEFGYWLGEPFWNKGIMTKVVKAFTEYCFSHLDYQRLEAPIFHFNSASERVLEKAGYHFEADIKQHYEKDGKFIDAKLYVKHADDALNGKY